MGQQRRAKDEKRRSNYLLRDIPQDLWKRAKHHAADTGDSLRDIILKSLEAYLK